MDEKGAAKRMEDMTGMAPTSIACLLSKLFTWIVILTMSFMLASQRGY